MTSRRAAVALLVLILVVAGGYFGYTFLKNKPPAFLIDLLTKTEPPPPLPSGNEAPLIVPEGFQITIFSRETPGARVMVKDFNGTLLVSETSQGRVVALKDENNDGVAESPVVVLDRLDKPHGLLLDCSETSCTLYVAETGVLKSYEYDPENLTALHPVTLATFPTGDGHYTRTLMMHPDGERMLISIGSSCNVCNEENPLRASIQALHLETRQLTPFATGLRNSVFLATNPVTGEVWASENGRDVIGDDIPPDEINIIREGGNYGWPICYGQRIHDRDFDKNQYIRDPCADTVPSHIDLQAHSAALGLVFVPEEGWPDGMGNDLLVAYHGSWNRSVPTGYKVVRFDLTDQGTLATPGPIDFITGFLPAGGSEDDAIGRPVGLLIEPGGTLYVSDDRAGAIYRVTRTSL